MFIYIHLPFCLSHCIYCDFYVELKGTPDRRRAYIDALKTEIIHYLGQQDPMPIQTVYLGGGTPGLFCAGEINDILTTLRSITPFSPEAEITLEANPEGTASPLQDYRDIGINRLSIGVQSLQPNELKRLSRVHSRDQVYRFMETVVAAGYTNVSIDLMYGIPEQTMASWADTLQQVGTLPIQHISMYGLKVEPETGLAKVLQSGRMALPTDETTVEMYEFALPVLAQYGFDLYEISNLCRPGFASRHNLAYWDNQAFWGFGVSAHGYIQECRYENPRDLKAYLENPLQRAHLHPCSREEQLENAFIFGLRKRSGVSIAVLEARYGFDFNTTYAKRLSRYFETGLLIRDRDTLRLSPEAIPVSNTILADFLEPVLPD